MAAGDYGERSGDLSKFCAELWRFWIGSSRTTQPFENVHFASSIRAAFAVTRVEDAGSAQQQPGYLKPNVQQGVIVPKKKSMPLADQKVLIAKFIPAYSHLTVKYAVEFDDEVEIEVDVPVNATRDSAKRLFIEAVEKELDLLSTRCLVVSKAHREYHGHGGMFEIYQMSNDRSGHIFGSHWIEAYAV